MPLLVLGRAQSAWQRHNIQEVSFEGFELSFFGLQLQGLQEFRDGHTFAGKGLPHTTGDGVRARSPADTKQGQHLQESNAPYSKARA